MKNLDLVTKSLLIEFISAIMVFALLCNPAGIYAAEVTPNQLEFRRQAVRRMIFDRSQDIPLAGLWPANLAVSLANRMMIP